MHPYKSQCSDHRSAGRDRYKAEGGKVEQFPISLAQADHNRMKLDRAISTVSQRYNPDTMADAVSRLPSAKVLLGPGAAKKSGGSVKSKGSKK